MFKRYGKDTIKQADDLIQVMRRNKIEKFNQDVFGLTERNEIERLVKLAKEYNKIQEHDCNGTKTSRMESRELNIETEIRAIATNFGFKVHFDGDPRGFCVKLHAPKRGICNTWGGEESGYGIG